MKNNNNKKNVTAGTIAVFIICSILAIFFPELRGGEAQPTAPATQAESTVVITTKAPTESIEELQDDTQSVQTEALQDDVLDETPVEDSTAITYEFRSEKLLNEHYEKHGIEMGFDSAEAYLAAANEVLKHSDVLHKVEAEDGDDVYYLEETNEFVVVSTDGYIRTYFYPSAGIDYFNRQ